MQRIVDESGKETYYVSGKLKGIVAIVSLIIANINGFFAMKLFGIDPYTEQYLNSIGMSFLTPLNIAIFLLIEIIVCYLFASRAGDFRISIINRKLKLISVKEI